MVIVDKANAVAHADLVDLHGVTRTKVEMKVKRNLDDKLNQSFKVFEFDDCIALGSGVTDDSINQSFNGYGNRRSGPRGPRPFF